MNQCALAAIVIAAVTASASGSPAMAAPEPAGAVIMFQEAKQISDRDAGRFWGKSLYGPILFVDPTDLSALANEPDNQGALRPSGDVYVGHLPPTEIVASAPIEWAGKRWTELMWPLRGLQDPTGKVGDDWLAVTLAHEMFHRIQPSLGLTRPEIANVHLDTLHGRYLLQLEWRALARALSAPNLAVGHTAIADALLFRSERYRKFPQAAVSEAALEINEGIPEYTGVMLGLATTQARVRYALYDLSAWQEVPSYVRSFAYATGPAYGLLLDKADPAWRSKLNSSQRLDQMLAAATRVGPLAPAKLASREADYDKDGRLYASEVRRDQARLARLSTLKASLVDGPVLLIPLAKSNYSFRPQSLVPLEDYGVVYPTLKLSDEWGVLEVDHGGALLDKDMSRAAVSLAKGDIARLRGDGWRLTLKDGWSLQAGTRQGDFVVTRNRRSGP